MYFATAIKLSIICIIQFVAQTRSDCCAVGIAGSTGAPGPVGMKGDTGEKGQKGTPGLDGRDGYTGGIGLQGDAGEKGERGEKGEKGEQATTISQQKSAFSVAFESMPAQLPISPMKYPIIITNIGNVYNATTGKFVCQHPGTYVFHFNSLSPNNAQIFTTRIMKNGQRVVSASEQGSSHKSASNLVVLDLDACDEVWTEPAAGFNNYYSNSDRHCTFSGFLLYPS